MFHNIASKTNQKSHKSLIQTNKTNELQHITTGTKYVWCAQCSDTEILKWPDDCPPPEIQPNCILPDL